MNDRLKELVDCAINDLFDTGICMNSNQIQIVTELAEFAALRGKNDYMNEKLGSEVEK